MIDVSVVIVCMNRMDNLRPCLDSLKRNTNVSFEALVVAYMFSPENLKAAKDEYPWATFIESNELRGFSENNNLALKKAQGRFCFVLNDDTELPMDVIGKLVEDFSKLPENTAIVSPKIFSGDGSLQLCGRPGHDGLHYVLQQFHLWNEKADNVSDSKPFVDGIYRTKDITGAAFLIRTDIFRDLGWFDETYYFTPEDMALSDLARRRGYGVYVDSEVSLIHKWRTTASKLAPAVRPAAVRGSVIFFSRGSALKYALVGGGVWIAETSKMVKAALVATFAPSVDHYSKYLTFEHISRNIFTQRTPKEIFVKYYKELTQNV